MAISDRRLIAHLLRRAGFGTTASELDAYAALGFTGAVNQLVDYSQVSDDSVEAQVAFMENSLDLTKLESIQQIWLYRMLNTARPLQEKMTLFWHDHLANANSKVGKPDAMYRQNQFFRSNALGDFPGILRGISRDPAMIRFLDGNTNRKGAPNENYARELMELFTMGRGNYSETDVREGARAFTGWNLDKNFQFTFNAKQHDDGLKTFLNQRGKWNGDDVVRIILEQPVSARFMASKLFNFFVHDHPSSTTIQDLADQFRDNGFRVRELVRAIFLSADFASDDAYHAVIRSPVEYVIGLMKSFGIPQFLPGITGSLSRMGMQLFNPPGVAGWDWGTAWIGTNTYLERVNLANTLTSQRGENAGRGIDPAAMARQLGAITPHGLVDGLLRVLGDGDVDSSVRDALIDYASSGYSGPAEGFFDSAQRLDRAVRGIAHLIASSPVAQMA
ncbi:MAG TPA: DUF1800 domain-containing protein [Chloroflexota bacterium]